MIRNLWMRGVAASGFAVTALAASTFAQNPAPRPAPAPAAAPAPAPAQAAAAPAPRGQVAQHEAGDLPGPIDSLQDLQDTGKMLFKLADLNNDNLISQKEAIDAGNLLVGGFFFRADTNGDGTVSQEEARQARDSLLQQKPILRAILEGAKEEKGGAPGGASRSPGDAIRGIGQLLDANQDKQLQASEVRRAVETSVQSFYQTADTNRDGQLSPSELNAAMVGMARSAAQAAFMAADTDHNGSISKEEFDKSFEKPLHALFNAVDTNHDGQISQEEAQAARRTLMAQVRLLQVPEPANAAGNPIRTGQTPAETAPIPNFGVPRAGQSGAAPQPEPAPAAGRAPAQPRSR